MKITQDTRARLAALVAQGVLSAEVAKAALAATVSPEDGESCMACGSDALVRDYICGSCSMLKVDDERKFWERVRRSGAGKSDAVSRKVRPCSATMMGSPANAVTPVVVDRVEVRRMIDTLKVDLTLLSWREAFLRSIPEGETEMYERERVAVGSNRCLTEQLLSFWTFKRNQETIDDPRVSAGAFPAGAVA